MLGLLGNELLGGLWPLVGSLVHNEKPFLSQRPPELSRAGPQPMQLPLYPRTSSPQAKTTLSTGGCLLLTAAAPMPVDVTLAAVLGGVLLACKGQRY